MPTAALVCIEASCPVQLGQLPHWSAQSGQGHTVQLEVEALLFNVLTCAPMRCTQKLTGEFRELTDGLHLRHGAAGVT